MAASRLFDSVCVRWVTPPREAADGLCGRATTSIAWRSLHAHARPPGSCAAKPSTPPPPLEHGTPPTTRAGGPGVKAPFSSFAGSRDATPPASGPCLPRRLHGQSSPATMASAMASRLVSTPSSRTVTPSSHLRTPPASCGKGQGSRRLHRTSNVPAAPSQRPSGARWCRRDIPGWFCKRNAGPLVTQGGCSGLTLSLRARPDAAVAPASSSACLVFSALTASSNRPSRSRCRVETSCSSASSERAASLAAASTIRATSAWASPATTRH